MVKALYNSIHVSIEYRCCDSSFGSDGFTLFTEFLEHIQNQSNRFFSDQLFTALFSRIVNPNKQFIDDF